MSIASLANLYDVTTDNQTTFDVYLDIADGVNVDNLKVLINGKLLAGDLGRFSLVEDESKLSVSLATGLTPIDFFSDATLDGSYAGLLEENIKSFGFYLTIEGVDLSNVSNFTKIKTSNLEVGGEKLASWTTTGEFSAAQTGVVPADKYKNAYYVDGEYSYYRNADIATGNKVVATFYKPCYGDKLEEKTEHIACKIGQEEAKYFDILTETSEGTIVYQADDKAIVKFVIDSNMTGYALFVPSEGALEISFSTNEIEYLFIEFVAKPAMAEVEFSIEMRNQNVSVVDPE